MKLKELLGIIGLLFITMCGLYLLMWLKLYYYSVAKVIAVALPASIIIKCMIDGNR